MNFLHLLADGVKTGFTKTAVLKSYALGTAANVTRLKRSLTDKDLLTFFKDIRDSRPNSEAMVEEKGLERRMNAM